MQVLDYIKDDAFILIVWETCQGFISNRRQDQVSLWRGFLELKSREHTGGGKSE